MSTIRDNGALLLAVLLILSSVAPFAGVAGAVSGMTTIPDSNITEDVPSGASLPVDRTDFTGGAVETSRHAETLELVLTTKNHADEVMGNDSLSLDGDGMALVLRDREHHAGREVAIDAGVLKNALGYVPKWVHGTGDDGDRWRRATTYEDGMVVFEVPGFSSNTITFESEVSVSASPATDGTTIQYGLSSTDGVSDLVINATGVTNTENESVMGYGTQVNQSINPAGSTISGGTLTVTGTGSGDQIASGGSLSTTIEHQMSGYIRQVTVQVYNDAGAYNTPRVDVYADGTQIDDWSTTNNLGPNEKRTITVDLGRAYQVSNKVTIQIGGNSIIQDNYWSITEPPNASNVVVDVGGTAYDIGTLNDTQTVTKSLSLDSSSSLNISADGYVNYSLSWTEKTTTTDPAVQLNGHWTNHTGTLADGETVTLDANASWIQDGTNRINVSVGDGSLSTDAPDPVVGLSYSHTAQDKQEVFYQAEQWSESYNVSKTFASEREQASLVVPYASEIVAIRDLAVEINNSGTWNAIDSTAYSLDATTLTVDLDEVYGGTIPTNTTIAVKTTGSRVETHNVTITVIEPTLTSDELDTKIRVDSKSAGAYIGVGPTPEGERIHYTASETWTDPSEYVLIEAGGGQKLHVPGAGAGDTFRVRHVATKAAIESGDAKISVVDAGETPEFKVSPGPSGPGDTLELTYYNTESGTTYLLQAIVDGSKKLIDSAVANSPVTLTMTDENYLVGIFEGSSSTSGDGSGDGGGGGTGGVSVGSSLFIVLSVVALTGVWVASQRFGSGRVSTRTYLALSGGVVVIFGLEVLSGALVSGLLQFLTSSAAALFASLSQAWPIAILVAGGLAYLWLQNRGKPTKEQNIIIRAIKRGRG